VSRDALPPGVERRTYTRRDGSLTESFTVRFTDDDGVRRRRSFDTAGDALDFLAKRRSAKRWRPEELRQEQRGQTTLTAFFDQWWRDYAMVDLKRSTLKTYRCVWEAHAQPHLGYLALRDIDAPRIVRLRGDLLSDGVGPQSVVKTMAMLQRVFRDAVEAGEASFNPVKAVRKPSPGPTREVHPLTPLQIERLAMDLDLRGYRTSAFLVRVMAYTGLRPQEALALHWYAIREKTLLVELANADGELDRLKNRKRSRKRSRTVDLIRPLQEDIDDRRRELGNPGEQDLVFAHEITGGLWLDEHYRTWRRRIYAPSAANVALPSSRPYDLRHTWASLLIAEKRLSIAEIAEQLGDKVSTVLDTYTHVIHEWRGRKSIDIEREVRRARKEAGW
jgi:integrase